MKIGDYDLRAPGLQGNAVLPGINRVTFAVPLLHHGAEDKLGVGVGIGQLRPNGQGLLRAQLDVGRLLHFNLPRISAEVDAGDLATD
jgi:hypothetical protein